MDKIIAGLAETYPDGYFCFMNGDKRVPIALLYQRKTSYIVNINGVWRFYSRLGDFISAVHSNGEITYAIFLSPLVAEFSVLLPRPLQTAVDR